MAPRSGRTRRAAVAAGVGAALVVSYGVLDARDVVPGILTTADPAASAPAGAPAPSAGSASPGGPARARMRSADPADLPLPRAGRDAPLPTAAALSASLGPLLADRALGPAVGAEVRDGVSGQRLLATRADVPMTPASSAKLLTAAAMAAGGGLERTLDTTVLRGEGDAIVLVAGGDTLLAPAAGDPSSVSGRAGLGDLADEVAPALRDRASAVRVFLDDRALAGPAFAPTWAPADVSAGYVGSVSALGLATRRATPASPVTGDQALTAAEAFQEALGARGVNVEASVSRGAAPADAETLGTIRSAPIADQLALALDESDNTLTETLARDAAVRHGQSATFEASAAWVREQLLGLGVGAEAVRLVDTSGLSDGSVVPAQTLAGVLTLAADGSLPGLARVIAQLPVAGLSGTLTERFRTGPQRAAAGLVRAKTGTLTGVSSLSGTVVDADGRLLVFALLADQVPADGTLDARAALDRAAASLASCGCRD